MFEPVNSGPRGQHANHLTTEAATRKVKCLMWSLIQSKRITFGRFTDPVRLSFQRLRLNVNVRNTKLPLQLNFTSPLRSLHWLLGIKEHTSETDLMQHKVGETGRQTDHKRRHQSYPHFLNKDIKLPAGISV
jgi:hypothetical protein